MQKIVYAGGEFLTGDEIATALLEYSRALGQEDTAQIVEIPIVEQDGSRGTAKFLIGPASQIVIKSARTGFEELTDHDVVERLRSLARRVHFPEASTLDEPEQGAIDHPFYA
jgi:hypothetical protein